MQDKDEVFQRQCVSVSLSLVTALLQKYRLLYQTPILMQKLEKAGLHERTQDANRGLGVNRSRSRQIIRNNISGGVA